MLSVITVSILKMLKLVCRFGACRNWVLTLKMSPSWIQMHVCTQARMNVLAFWHVVSQSGVYSLSHTAVHFLRRILRLYLASSGSPQPWRGQWCSANMWSRRLLTDPVPPPDLCQACTAPSQGPGEPDCQAGISWSWEEALGNTFITPSQEHKFY